MGVLRKPTPERLIRVSDGVFAVPITVLVPELRPPGPPIFAAPPAPRPTWPSCAVSSLFIAIVRTNHLCLMRPATEANARLPRFNVVHLFSLSLLPLSSAWMTMSERAPRPAAFDAAVFFPVDATDVCLMREPIDRTPLDEIPPKVRRIKR